MIKEKKLNKIEGWLAFYIIILFMGAIANIYVNFFVVPNLFFYNFIESIGLISLPLVTAFLLMDKKYYAPVFAKVYLFVIIIHSLMYITDPIMAGTSVGSLISSIIWLAYFSKSKRVKEVYLKQQRPKKGHYPLSYFAIVYSIFAPTAGAILGGLSLYKISKNRKLKGILLSVLAIVISIIIYSAYTMFILASFSTSIEADFYCSDICYEKEGAEYYLAVPNSDPEFFDCVCSNALGEGVYEEKILYSEAETYYLN